MSSKIIKTVLVTGGAGYVGACTVPKLLKAGYEVKVLDLYLYGEHVFQPFKANPRLTEIKGDLRDSTLVDRALTGVDAVIHLACISNDPSYELNPSLGKSINYDCFLPLVQLSKANGISRFIYASSSSVYGIKEEPEVTEDLPLLPLTDYSKYKAMCEEVLLKEAADHFTCLIVRPSTVCGYSPRLRLDLTVNILTNHAINDGVIKVYGGQQKRPNIHIEDMSDLYLEALRWPHEKIHKKVFNVGYENHTVNEIARMVKEEIGSHVKIEHVPTSDDRSYHVSSKKIREELDFVPKHTIREAIQDLKHAMEEGLIPDPMSSPRYYNVKMMKLVNLQ